MRSVHALLNHVSFLHPQYQALEDIPGGVQGMARAQQVRGDSWRRSARVRLRLCGAVLVLVLGAAEEHGRWHVAQVNAM
jgi:hypothetical protein